MHFVPQLVTTVTIFFICIGCDGLRQTDGQYLQGLDMDKEVRFCGPLLTNTLELVCAGRFNTMMKKAEDDSGANNANRDNGGNGGGGGVGDASGGTPPRDWTSHDRANFAIFPFRNKRSALALNKGKSFRRRTRNVADECCFLKSCTIAEISNYCAGN